jgi:hypothetical protein
MTEVDSPRWAPVVYGRTRHRDQWWQAIPRDVDETWIEPLVMATVAGGADLADGRRFLLARGSDSVCVGVACRARELSAEMHRDAAGRELYCFVGWVAPTRAAAPTLADLRASYVEWAGQVYARRMRDEWERPSYEPLQAERTAATATPWPAPRSPSPAAADGRSRAWPPGEADRPWEMVRAATGPAAVSVGWAAAAEARVADVAGPFHIVAEDVAAPRPLPPRPAPPEPKLPEVILPREPVRDLERPRHAGTHVTQVLATICSPMTWLRICLKWFQSPAGARPVPELPAADPPASTTKAALPPPRPRGEPRREVPPVARTPERVALTNSAFDFGRPPPKGSDTPEQDRADRAE